MTVTQCVVLAAVLVAACSRLPHDADDDIAAFVRSSGSVRPSCAAATASSGVISPDMGTGGNDVQTCEPSDRGDDGVLQHAPTAAGCAPEYPTFLTLEAGADVQVATHDFACLATLGMSGCGFEQPLKALDGALIDRTDGANEGFLRRGSHLGIVMVTDEDDCSTRAGGDEIFNTDLALGPPILRCVTHGAEYLESVRAFVDRLLPLRDCPEHLSVAGIVGVPLAQDIDCKTSDMTSADYDCLLDAPALKEVIDNSAEGKGERFTPSCDEALGAAYPARRILEYLQALDEAGAHTTVQSVCQDDYSAAIREIVRGWTY